MLNTFSADVDCGADTKKTLLYNRSTLLSFFIGSM